MDLSTLTIEQLKSLAYDFILQIKQGQENLQTVEQVIMQRAQVNNENIQADTESIEKPE
jgi:hypothetical protein